MKSRRDPRHKKRQEIIKLLFSYSFSAKPTKSRHVSNLLLNIDKIDEIIKKIAPVFPVDKINKIDLAILRLAVYELMIEKKQPTKVIIDEAIELAKEFGGDNSPAFINGALGKILEEKNENTDF